MQLHAKKRVEIIVEAPFVDRLTRKLDELKVPGYTVTPALAGRGRERGWKREGSVSKAGIMMCVIIILDAGAVETLLEAVFPPLERQIGILSVSDTMVVRGERF